MMISASGVPLPRYPRDCQSSRLNVRRPCRQITVGGGGRATTDMPLLRFVEHAAGPDPTPVLRARTIAALTITEGDALFANGNRQTYEAPRDVARHAIVRDRPFVPIERHARITPDTTDPISPLRSLLHLPRRGTNGTPGAPFFAVEERPR